MSRLLAWCRTSVLVAVAAAGVGGTPAAALAGCNGAGAGPGRGVITPRNASHFSKDAQILTAGAAAGPWLCAKRAAMFDRDLRRIRAGFPAVADVHAIPAFVLDQLLIDLDTGAPWLSRWTSGSIRTGDADVDRLLGRFRARTVRHLFTFHGDVSFVVGFGEPLNIPALVDDVRSSSAYFHVVQPNWIIGDGNRITFKEMSRRRVYTFSLGWGDCPAGCASRHFWEFTLSPTGGIALREYGTPLPSATRHPL